MQIPLRRLAGAHAARVIAGPRSSVPEHAHDWPMLSLYVMGNYRKTFDGGEVRIRGPSAVLHGAKRNHANHFEEAGLEQVDIEFDPAWFGRGLSFSSSQPVQCWTGGPVAAAASRLARMWCNPAVSEPQLQHSTAKFLTIALAARDVREPAWLPSVLQSLDIASAATAPELARPLGLHPSWLAQAYRHASGEGLRETVQRLRVERATSMLRDSELPLAEIAADAGFCDQSHMNRIFRRLLGRTPLEVRVEGLLMSEAN